MAAARERRRRAERRRSRIRRAAAVVVLALLASGTLLGFAYAGSPATLAEGIEVAGVDVGGLTVRQAQRVLERRARAVENVPVVFTAGSRRWRIAPARVGLKVDWRAALDAARRSGDGFGPLRGFKRLEVRFFGADISPPVAVREPELNVRIRTIGAVHDRRHREAAIRLRGLRPVLVREQAGRVLDRENTAQTMVRALSGFSRTPVALPFRVDRARVTAADLAPALADARTAVSAPVRLTLGTTYLRLPRWRIARLLDLPENGQRAVTIGGNDAAAYFARLEKFVNREPSNAGFAVYADGVRIVPDKEGRRLDVARTKRNLLAAVLRRARRVAPLVVATREAERTTEDARAMGITGLVGAYETFYGGDPNRIHNVQLVARLIDEHLIAPGEEFSFNETTGERNAEKGFLEAPVIINGELQNGIGGGVCQVSTTTFNAAFEAGLKITSRTNHALYISHYPQGRDATVDYPNIDLRFVNDTGHWLLLRTWVGSDRLTVALYGTPVHRRVQTEVSELKVTGEPPVEKTPDPELYVGEEVVDEEGVPSRSTSVRRVVYDADGDVLYDDTWYSSYRAEPKEVRVGTKPKPKPKPKPKKETETAPTTTEPTETDPASTEPTETTPADPAETDTTETETDPAPPETTPTEDVPDEPPSSGDYPTGGD